MFLNAVAGIDADGAYYNEECSGDVRVAEASPKSGLFGLALHMEHHIYNYNKFEHNLLK